MLTILGSLLGFLSSAFPDFIKLFQDKRDKAHELELLKFQAENADKLHTYEMQMQNIANSQNIDLAGIRFAESADNNIKEIKSKFVQALNAIVRPIIALGFLAIYFALKVMAYYAVSDNVPFVLVYETLWSEEDSAIFAAIITFYFGNRTLQKIRRNEG